MGLIHCLGDVGLAIHWGFHMGNIYGGAVELADRVQAADTGRELHALYRFKSPLVFSS